MITFAWLKRHHRQRAVRLASAPSPSFPLLRCLRFRDQIRLSKFWPGPLFSAWVGEGTGDERYPGHDQYKKALIFKQLALYLMITYEVYLSGYMQPL